MWLLNEKMSSTNYDAGGGCPRGTQISWFTCVTSYGGKSTKRSDGRRCSATNTRRLRLCGNSSFYGVGILEKERTTYFTVEKNKRPLPYSCFRGDATADTSCACT